MAAAGRSDIVSNIFSLSVEISNEELDEIVERLSLRDFIEFLTRLETELPSESTDAMMSDLIGNFPEAYGQMYVPSARNYPASSKKMRSLVWVYFFIMIKFLRANIYSIVLRGRTHLKAKVFGVKPEQKRLQNVVRAFDTVDNSKASLNNKINSAEASLIDTGNYDVNKIVGEGSKFLESVKNFIPIAQSSLTNISPSDINKPTIETTLNKNLILQVEKDINIIFGEELANRPKTRVRVQEQPDKRYKLVQYYKNGSWQNCSKDIFIKESDINLTGDVRAVKKTLFAPTLRF